MWFLRALSWPDDLLSLFFFGMVSLSADFSCCSHITFTTWIPAAVLNLRPNLGHLSESRWFVASLCMQGDVLAWHVRVSPLYYAALLPFDMHSVIAFSTMSCSAYSGVMTLLSAMLILLLVLPSGTLFTNLCQHGYSFLCESQLP